MAHSAIAVFTRKSVDALLSDGGSGYWVLKRRKARACQYVVCARNARAADHGAHEAHRAAFLVGEITDIMEAEADARGNRRFLIAFDKYAQIEIPEAWQLWRNPVRYTTMEDLGIDPDQLTFKTRRERLDDPEMGSVAPLTIAQAKSGLAATFGVDPAAIEIVIRA